MYKKFDSRDAEGIESLPLWRTKSTIDALAKRRMSCSHLRILLSWITKLVKRSLWLLIRSFKLLEDPIRL